MSTTLAVSRLGAGNFAMLTVPAEEVADLYRASDLFVLASLAETQGRALIEAAAQAADRQQKVGAMRRVVGEIVRLAAALS